MASKFRLSQFTTNRQGTTIILSQDVSMRRQPLRS